MSLIEQATAAIVKIKGSAANIAGDVRTLKEKIEGLEGGIDQSQAEALVAELEGIATNLDTLAGETPDEPATGDEPEPEAEEE